MKEIKNAAYTPSGSGRYSDDDEDEDDDDYGYDDDEDDDEDDDDNGKGISTTLAGHDVRRDVLRLLHDYNRQNEGSIRCQTPFSSRLWK